MAYVLRFQNRAANSVLSLNNPGQNAAFVFDTGNQTLKTLSNPTAALHLHQSERAQFAGVLSCLRGAATVVFSNSFKRTLVILVSDENAKNGVSLLGKSNRSFTVSCLEAFDSFGWIAVGNPDW